MRLFGRGLSGSALSTESLLRLRSARQVRRRDQRSQPVRRGTSPSRAEPCQPVPGVGLEPTWPEGHGVLSAARLTSSATRARGGHRMACGGQPVAGARREPAPGRRSTSAFLRFGRSMTTWSAAAPPGADHTIGRAAAQRSRAGVVELVDTPALGAGGASLGGSSPSARIARSPAPPRSGSRGARAPARPRRYACTITGAGVPSPASSSVSAGASGFVHGSRNADTNAITTSATAHQNV
jgi:hypothetical protein